jgi:hypothetical protein
MNKKIIIIIKNLYNHLNYHLMSQFLKIEIIMIEGIERIYLLK